MKEMLTNGPNEKNPFQTITLRDSKYLYSSALLAVAIISIIMEMSSNLIYQLVNHSLSCYPVEAALQL